MLQRFCITDDDTAATIPLWPLKTADLATWHAALPPARSAWVEAHGFKAEAGRFLVCPEADGTLAGAVLGLGDAPHLWCYGGLAGGLPAGRYRIEGGLTTDAATAATIGWGLGAYSFDRYNTKPPQDRATLVRPAVCDLALAERTLAATYLVRDLVNTPAEDMGPAELAEAAGELAQEFAAEATVIEGEALLAHDFPTIHAVGRASARAPRLIDLRWGEPDAPKVTLVGKGVCFDSGGLDLKSAAGMRLMKKDMGGAATVLGLGRMVMAAALPVRLRILVPAVENAVSGTAFRPGDVVRTRKGVSVEIGNTDAEGRLVLADTLAEADAEKPQLLIDCATLTGAARIALGTDLPALFTDDDGLAQDLARHAEVEHDPLWRMPLWRPYRALLDTPIADIDNVGTGRFAGAITAALFLKEFVTETRSWAHIDLYAWNDKARPGRPVGGEALGLRALFALLAERFAT